MILLELKRISLPISKSERWMEDEETELDSPDTQGVHTTSHAAYDASTIENKISISWPHLVKYSQYMKSSAEVRFYVDSQVRFIFRAEIRMKYI
jgi:hypothetical protein